MKKPQKDDLPQDRLTKNQPSYDNGFRFNQPIRETPGETKFRLFEYHQAAGSMEHFYDLYPESRPKGRDKGGGRGR